MADRGLLRSFPVVCMALLLQTGCQHYAPRVAGRVVDAESGVGIGGVEVFRTVSVVDRFALLTGSPVFDIGGEGISWATTASDGSFEIPAAPLGVGKLRWKLEHTPTFTWVHRDYGWGLLAVAKADLDRVGIRIERDPEKVEKMANTRKLYGWGPCDFREIEAADHCCDVAFGWSSGCDMRGQ